MSKFNVTVRGIGQAGNSPRQINETFEVDDKVRADIMNSSKKAATLEAILLTKCPGVIVDGSKLGCNIEEINEPIVKKEKIKEIATAAAAGAIAGALVSEKASQSNTETKIKGNVVNKPVEPKVQKNIPQVTSPYGVKTKMIQDFTWIDNVDDTIERLNFIGLETTGLKWTRRPKTNVEKENNRILSKVFKQYNVGYKHFLQIIEYEDITKEYKKFKRRYIWSKYKILMISGFSLFVILVTILLTYEKF